MPTIKKNRIETLDFIRGISLFGILLVNILAFNFPIQYVEIRTILTIPSDLQYEKMLSIFIAGSFYPIFSMLFGYGLAMQYEQTKVFGTAFYKKSVKRMTLLLAIGILHAVFIWYGDILMMYAIFGFLVISVVKIKPKYLILIATILILYFQIPNFYNFIIAETNPTEFELQGYSDLKNMKADVDTATSGNWIAVFKQNLINLKLQISPSMWVSGLSTILPYMLIGVVASKWHLIEEKFSKKYLWLVLFISMLPLGVFLKLQGYQDRWTYLGVYFKDYIGGPVLAIGYIAGLVLLTMIPGVLRVVKPISTVGRMSLTTYLMQSIIQGLIFYNYGLGLYSQYGLDGLVLIALAIYIAQIAFSIIWLSFFRQGPVEALWKKLVSVKMTMQKQDSV